MFYNNFLAVQTNLNVISAFLIKNYHYINLINFYNHAILYQISQDVNSLD